MVHDDRVVDAVARVRRAPSRRGGGVRDAGDVGSIDLNDALRYNGPGVRLAAGFNDFPRDTVNGSVTVFKGAHELKFGGDIQQIEFGNLTSIGKGGGK